MTDAEKLVALQQLIDTARKTKSPAFIYFKGERRKIRVWEGLPCWTIEDYYDVRDDTLFMFNLLVHTSIELPKILHLIELEKQLTIKEII